MWKPLKQSSCLAIQAAGLLNLYECWGIDLEGQGDSPEAENCDVNMLQRHADDLLAVIDRLGCKGAPQPGPVCMHIALQVSLERHAASS